MCRPGKMDTTSFWGSSSLRCAGHILEKVGRVWYCYKRAHLDLIFSRILSKTSV